MIAGRRDGSRVDTSVMGWFLNLKEMLDCMPDKDIYQVAAPWKKDVYRWSVSSLCVYLCKYFGQVILACMQVHGRLQKPPDGFSACVSVLLSQYLAYEVPQYQTAQAPPFFQVFHL